jgi:hypothetical protein
MINQFPTCDRVFEGISDYPFVYVAKFERLEIPSGIVFPDYSHTIYVGPNYECNNPRPSQEVLNFFKGNKQVEEFEHEGYTWHRRGKWDSGYYHRSRNDAKDVILAQLNPYFDTLDGLVGQEVPTAQVLPSFGETRHGYCRIPETSYDLTLEVLDGEWGTQMLKQNNLSVSNLETSQPTRKLTFVITQSDGGSISEVHFLASVGGLAYEGRVHK